MPPLHAPVPCVYRICTHVRSSEKCSFFCTLKHSVHRKFSVSVVVESLRYRLQDPGFEYRQGHEIYIFSKTSRLALGSPQPLMHWIPVILPLGKSGQGVRLNHCCCGTATNITYLRVRARSCLCVPGRVGVCMCMRVRACILANAPCNTYTPYCDVICDPSGSTIFRHYLINGTIFEKKLLNIKCVFLFSL